MKKLQILAVDDNVVNLRLIVQELQDKYEVIPMSSGDRAIRYLRKEHADLILLDVQMPDLDGIETLQEIRNQGGTMIPVIFLTSSNDKATVMEGMKLGIMDYIVKPFQREDLLFRIERTLKRNGAIPIAEGELHQRVTELAELVRNSQWRQATALAREIAGYQIADEVAGRVRIVKTKLEANEYEAAEQAVDRVLRMLETQAVPSKKSNTLTQLEWSMKLHLVLDSLTQMHTQSAVDQMNDLLRYEMQPDQRKSCEQVLDYLKDYDDAEAETMLIQMLEQATRL